MDDGSRELARVIAEAPPALRSISARLREVIREEAPSVREAVKWGAPTWSGRRLALCLMIYPNHVNLGFFQGARLADRFPEIVGTGRALRHARIPSLEVAGSETVRRMVRAAMDLDREEPGPAPRRGTGRAQKPSRRRAVQRGTTKRPGRPAPGRVM